MSKYENSKCQDLSVDPIDILRNLLIWNFGFRSMQLMMIIFDFLLYS